MAVPTGLTLENELARLTAAFSAVFDVAPVLPRPLPIDYVYITLQQRSEQLNEVAPIKPLTPLASIHVRRLRRLCLLICKAAEFAHIHKRLHRRNTLENKVISAASLATSSASAALLFVFGNDELTTRACGLAVTLVATAQSWTRYAQYERYSEKHREAHRDFSKLVKEMRRPNHFKPDLPAPAYEHPNG